MKKFFFALVIVSFLSFLMACDKTPTSPDIPISGKDANFILVDSTQEMTGQIPGQCIIRGTLENVGEATGYNVRIVYSAYNESEEEDVTAIGMLAGDIPVGVSANFNAVFNEIYDWELISEPTYEIIWESR